ncbi:SRS domain-containing protein [Neospora caninum Liverpool]|uniref:SRS domain-containing protein n=1 Tax=Neospora caninum (strain Liverpool) TaxID=572307 RepID=F0VPW5_NEOCL|nr:SRS domain-containing protein [Neospora caninum Liverpool]CBZ55762.1 SRS domain-containing protein [Neospora caninum Liverpool]CEL70506.1 TPA: SRS domain-containing protein [Neospora caninum Liverpool]|eukprot:XP_003885788.1 SRS domain-containing protein [Neospora caninum Liverpool]
MARAARMQQRRGGCRSKARKLIAVCMGGVFLLCSRHAVADQPGEGALSRTLEVPSGSATMDEPAFTGQEATCELTGGSRGRVGSPTATGLTVSKENLTATLRCTGANNSVVPTDAKNVCVATVNDPTVAKCESHSDDGSRRQTTLQSLLGTANEIQGKITGASSDSQGQIWTLNLQESDLPLTDKAFFVGCVEQAGDRRAVKVECKVDVNVTARPSAVGENNLVTCAYGKNSNPAPLKVEMTTENNTLTLQCGSEGILHPTTYETRYCDPEEADLKKCNEKDYVGILPSFVESWWTNADAKTSATLTIPVTEFPESEQKFRVGCVPNTTNSQGPDAATKARENDDSEADATTSNCSVIVTVKSGSSASSTCQMVATVSGAAALLGLLVGSL